MSGEGVSRSIYCDATMQGWEEVCEVVSGGGGLWSDGESQMHDDLESLKRLLPALALSVAGARRSE